MLHHDLVASRNLGSRLPWGRINISAWISERIKFLLFHCRRRPQGICFPTPRALPANRARSALFSDAVAPPLPRALGAGHRRCPGPAAAPGLGPRRRQRLVHAAFAPLRISASELQRRRCKTWSVFWGSRPKHLCFVMVFATFLTAGGARASTGQVPNARRARSQKVHQLLVPLSGRRGVPSFGPQVGPQSDPEVGPASAPKLVPIFGSKVVPIFRPKSGVGFPLTSGAAKLRSATYVFFALIIHKHLCGPKGWCNPPETQPPDPFLLASGTPPRPKSARQ